MLSLISNRLLYFSLLFTFFLRRSTTNTDKIYSISANDSVLLPGCPSKDKEQTYWNFQENVLFMDGFLVRSNFSSSVTLLSNNSLYFNSISLLDVGKYECIKNHQSLSTYFIEVEGL